MRKLFRGTPVGPEEPRLTVNTSLRVGTLVVNATFQLSKPWTVLFGPSGSGKSTVLRLIAGLAQPDMGTLHLVFSSDRVQQRTKATIIDTELNVFLPPPLRASPLAPQLPNLFPHWTVADNLTMCNEQHSHADSGEILALFRIGHLKDKLPKALSGGEAQRVNLARAVTWAQAGGILLLDEPFNGMDGELRDEIIRDMKIWLIERNIFVLSVTHDVAEAFQLGAEVIKIADGKVIAQGHVDVVLAEERERLLDQLGTH